MASAGEFIRNLEIAADNILDDIDTRLKQAAIKMDETAVNATPVDTGRARGGWNASMTRPDTSSRGALDTSGGVTIAKARSVHARQMGIGRKAYLTNNVEYINFLDKGTSAQAPRGMTRQAIQAARIALQRIDRFGILPEVFRRQATSSFLGGFNF